MILPDLIRKFLLLTLLVATLILSGCRRERKLPEHVDAHYVEYSITYLEEKAGDINTKILPKSMEAYYTKYHVLTSIEGFFNQFSLIQIADLRRRRVTTMLNFFGNKVYYVGAPGEIPAGIVEPGAMKLTETGETTEIGGLNSVKMDVKTDQEEYSIYFTRDFSTRRPNISTPYRKVHFPLTDFRIQLSLLKMHLTCSLMEYKSVESEIFSVPEKYKPVNKETMEEIINSLFTND
jgi:hypothetical protein